MLELSPLQENDQDRWRVLARGYMAFYKTIRSEDEYTVLWDRIIEMKDVLSVGARIEGKLVGFSHYFFHGSSWSADVCYLQDLFVDEENRGHGIGKALIEYVAEQAKTKQSPRLYWLTHHENSAARVLYDKVASHSGFIKYERALG